MHDKRQLGEAFFTLGYQAWPEGANTIRKLRSAGHQGYRRAGGCYCEAGPEHGEGEEGCRLRAIKDCSCNGTPT